MKLVREIFGYLLGGVLFVGAMPVLMWLVSGMPPIVHIGAVRASITGLLIVFGLGMSVWSIVYMRRKGDGNPMDAFGHEVAPRTRRMMTEGPYGLSRNPMLTGIFFYLAGFGVWLWRWQAVAFFVVFVMVMLLQVRSEEERLHRDFGDEYAAYCRRTGRFFPRIKKHMI